MIKIFFHLLKNVFWCSLDDKCFLVSYLNVSYLNSAKDSERSKKERKTEEQMGR